MGGLNSGPPRTTATWPTFAECLTVPIHRLKGLVRGTTSSLRLEWEIPGSGRDRLAVNVSRDVAGGVPEHLLFDYWVMGDRGWNQVRLNVALTRTHQRRGQRVWFVCPRCCRRTCVLALPPGAEVFGCRICHQITSRSRRDRRRLTRSDVGNMLGIA